MAINRICSLKDCSWLPLESLRNSTLFITGGTGLVGHDLIDRLVEIQAEYCLKIIALVRDEQKARKIFSPYADRIHYIVGDVTQPIHVDEPIDYIIHGAAITSSQTFIEKPVETIITSINGTRNVLELAKAKNVRSVVYMSSMEAYGSPQIERPLTEDQVDYLNPLSLRSSYPESKRLCENLCVAYAKEYNISVKIARLALTFGPGILPSDRRVLIQFINSALRNQNIEIKTSGKSARMYLYTFDATTALLTLLLKGEAATAYNLANKETYCSIRQLADLVTVVTGSSSLVLTDTGSQAEKGMYPPDSFLYLDTSRLEALGWKACVSMQEGLAALVQSLEDKV